MTEELLQYTWLLSLRNFFKEITHCFVVMSCMLSTISISNSMICSDILIFKYHQWYFKIVILMKFETILKYHEWYLCQISLQIVLLFVYTTRGKRFVLFTCRYFKLSWNTTALSQSNCRKFSCSRITTKITIRWLLFPCTCTYIQVFQTYNTFSILLFQYILWKETWDMVHFTLLNLRRRKDLQSWLVGSLLCERFRVWFPCATSNPSFNFFTSCVALI